MTLETPGTTSVGKAMAVKVHIEALNGKKVNLEYPARMTVLDPTTWKLTSGRGKLVPEESDRPKRATLMGTVEALSAGKHTLRLRIAFSVCTNEQCLMKKVVLSDSIQVK